ncbi:hypothetical protein FA13DRAFT_1648663 [Coprinellus micaceus]|uniref:DNA 3'-5' helicase n=1 Tax=Coprinellus micaceus TaxID=71717 RepID=A0A4Y7SA81_COPMI|nr:hypothetical protein FA13DRAFT_1648663 [Coprinellus micaceus]
MRSYGVHDRDTMQAAKEEKPKRNLFSESRTKNSIILISPEELRNPECRILLDSKEFKARVTHLRIDEAHLIFNWGKFCDEFLQLGHVRARFPRTPDNQYIPVIATTATIREGTAKDEICRILDLKTGEYHLLRRSNIRPDIQGRRV